MPKAQIADLVDSRFQDLRILTPDLMTPEEALKNPENVLARSEHPLELAGPSGLVDSWPLVKVLAPEESAHSLTDPKDLYLKLLTHDPYGEWKNREFSSHNIAHIHRYADLTGQNADEIIRQYRFSFWRMIEGRNATVVADDAVAGRMHVFLADRLRADTEMGTSCLLTLDCGLLTSVTGLLKKYVSRDQLYESARTLCDAYKRLQTSGLFDGDECPIMEFQQDPCGQIYFLQYHFGRRKSDLPDFDFLSREDSGYTRAFFVRGKTPPEGIEYDVLCYSRFEWQPAIVTGAAHRNFFPPYEHVLEQASLRGLSLYLGFTDPNHFEFLMGEPSHASVSQLFKPELTVWADMEEQVLHYDELFEMAKKNGLSRIRVHVVSNGREARVKYLGVVDS